MTPRVLTLMFHRVHDQSQDYQPERFAHYLEYLVQNFPIVLPSDSLKPNHLSICLTFDDAYFDFYHHVYPLLQQHNIKAILAVPTKYIDETTTNAPQTRLSVPYAYDMDDPKYTTKTPLCTWQELKEMAHSGHVIMASHSYSHANLADKRSNLSQEIFVSKQMLQERLDKPIDYFIYPFGKMTKSVHQQVCQHYEYGIRIGSALNLGWDRKNRYIYRMDADHLWLKSKPIDKKLLNKLTRKYWLNKIRGK